MILRYEKERVYFEKVVNPDRVERLEVFSCDIKNLKGIAGFTNLREIHIHYCKKLEDLSLISELESLEQINLFSLPKVKIEFNVDKLQRLKSLSYTSVSKVSSIAGIDKLKGLIHLGLSRVKIADKDYLPIIRSKSLKRVFWFGAPFPPPSLKEIRNLRPDIIVGGNAYNVAPE